MHSLICQVKQMLECKPTESPTEFDITSAGGNPQIQDVTLYAVNTVSFLILHALVRETLNNTKELQDLGCSESST